MLGRGLLEPRPVCWHLADIGMGCRHSSLFHRLNTATIGMVCGKTTVS